MSVKNKIEDTVIIISLWLMTLALLYIVILKIKFLLHH
jgi:hypothetical protein